MPDMLSAEQICKLLAYLSQIIVEEVPVNEYRKNIMKRLGEITKMVSAVAPEKQSGVVLGSASADDPPKNQLP